MDTLMIKVKGMVCHGCEKRLQNVLQTIDGIEEVIADYQQELVTIKTNSQVDKNVIYEKIADLGFEVTEED